ncbi:hypothetical protein D3C71_1318010 [compost metagenome]
MAQHVDAGNHGLGSKRLRGLGEQCRVAHRFGVDHTFVCTGRKAFAHGLNVSNAAANGQWHEAQFGNLRQQAQQGAALVLDLEVVAAQIVSVFGGDVEQDQFVDVPVGEPTHRVHGVTNALVDAEQLAAHDQPILEQQHRDEAFHVRSAKMAHQGVQEIEARFLAFLGVELGAEYATLRHDAGDVCASE